MKIRLDRSMYARAQRIADASNDRFAVWSGRAVCCYCFIKDQPRQPLAKLTRSNSVSVAVNVHADTRVTAQRVRECIALAIEEQDRRDAGWPWRYDRDILDAAIQIEAFLEKRVIGYKEAQAICDRRVAQRKEELRVAEKAKRKK